MNVPDFIHRGRAAQNAVDALAMQPHDVENIARLLGGEGDWWSCHFVRLVARSDFERRRRLRLAFPHHVEVVERHLGLQSTGEPE